MRGRTKRRTLAAEQRDVVGIDVTEGVRAQLGLRAQDGLDPRGNCAPRRDIVSRGAAPAEDGPFDRERGNGGVSDA